MQGQSYKEVGFLQTEDSGGDADISEEVFQTSGAEELNSLHADEYVPDGTSTTDARYFDKVRSKRGVNSCGMRDQGVFHPPSNRVKVDHERESMSGMYRGAGYNTQQGVINIEVDRGAPPPRAMTDEESESHVVGLCLANLYNLRKGTELFGERAEEAVVNELTQIDEFETYEPVHKHDLSEADKKRALESMMKVTEKR